MRSFLLLPIITLLILSSCKKEKLASDVQLVPKYMPDIIELSINGNYQYIVGDSVHLQVEAADQDGEVASVWFYLNGILWVVDDKAPWQQSFVYPDERSVVIAIYAMDNDGIISDLTAIETFRKELSPPNVLLDFDYSQFYEDGSVNIDFLSNSPDADIILSQVFLNDTLLLIKFQPYFSFTIDSLQPGIHKVWGRVEDSRAQVDTSDVIFFEIKENIPTEKINY